VYILFLEHWKLLSNCDPILPPTKTRVKAGCREPDPDAPKNTDQDPVLNNGDTNTGIKSIRCTYGRYCTCGARLRKTKQMQNLSKKIKFLKKIIQKTKKQNSLIYLINTQSPVSTVPMICLAGLHSLGLTIRHCCVSSTSFCSTASLLSYQGIVVKRL
jgi:hypothetical protein